MEDREPVTAASSHGEMQSNAIHLPAPTAWPFLMALGLTLVFAAFVTNLGIGILGLVLALAGAVGWFRDVFRTRHMNT